MRHEVVLGDGSQQFVDVFDGLVELGGETVAALVESAEIQTSGRDGVDARIWASDRGCAWRYGQTLNPCNDHGKQGFW